MIESDARFFPKDFNLSKIRKTKNDFIFELIKHEQQQNLSPLNETKKKEKINQYPIKNPPKILPKLTINRKEILKFDKVLVDVECSHDGSFKHVLKFLIPKKDYKVKKKPVQNIKISNKERKRREKQKEMAKLQKSCYFDTVCFYSIIFNLFSYLIFAI